MIISRVLDELGTLVDLFFRSQSALGLIGKLEADPTFWVAGCMRTIWGCILGNMNDVLTTMREMHPCSHKSGRCFDLVIFCVKVVYVSFPRGPLIVGGISGIQYHRSVISTRASASTAR
jgi:hypothetical protein